MGRAEGWDFFNTEKLAERRTIKSAGDDQG
jgi:hypothetical protein